MYIRQRFECELCHSVYDDEEQCTACERRHNAAVRVISARWRPADEMPTEVLIASGSGGQVPYIRLDMISRQNPTRPMANWQTEYMQKSCP